MKTIVISLILLLYGFSEEKAVNQDRNYLYFYHSATQKINGRPTFKAIYVTRINKIRKSTAPGGNTELINKEADKWNAYIKRHYRNATPRTEWFDSEEEARNVLSDQRNSFIANNYELEPIADWPAN